MIPFFATCVALAFTFQEPLHSPTMPTYLKGEVQVQDRTYPYLLLPPLKIVEGKTYPLVLFLHGVGERGTDNEIQKAHFPARMAQPELAQRYGAFVLAPQCPEDDSWANMNSLSSAQFVQDTEPTQAMKAALASLAKVIRKHPIDLNRMALTGLSMGGAGAWDLALRRPDVFTAVAPICGGGDQRTAHRLAGLPVLVWHGTADERVPVARSQAMVKALRALDIPVQFTELPGVGHNAWDRAYGPEGCLEELFAAQRNPAQIQAATAELLAKVLQADEKIAFLGDSITQAGNNDGGFVDLIRKSLSKVRPDVQIIPAGISGHKVPDLLKRFEADVMDKQATLVFIYIGINDVWHSTSGAGTPPEDFESGLRELIGRLQDAGITVVLTTPGIIGEKAHGSNGLDTMLDQFSAISRRVAREKGATLCDLSRAFRQHLRLFNPKNQEHSILTRDGVHLNPEGDRFLAIQAARALRRAVLARN